MRQVQCCSGPKFISAFQRRTFHLPHQNAGVLLAENGRHNKLRQNGNRGEISPMAAFGCTFQRHFSSLNSDENGGKNGEGEFSRSSSIAFQQKDRATEAVGAAEMLPPKLTQIFRQWRARLGGGAGSEALASMGQPPFTLPLVRLTHNLLELSKAMLTAKDRAYLESRFCVGDRVSIKTMAEHRGAERIKVERRDHYEISALTANSIELRLIPVQGPVHGFPCEAGDALVITKISKTASKTLSSLEFLDNSARWFVGQAGYELILYALGVKQMPFPTSPDPILVDPLAFNRTADGKQRTIPISRFLSFERDRYFTPDQVDAISAALNPDRPFVVVHGPTGAGKRQLAAEIIVQSLLQRDKRVLVHGSSKEQMLSLYERCTRRLRGTVLRGKTREEFAFLSGPHTHPRHLRQLLETHPDWNGKMRPLFNRLTALETQRDPPALELKTLREKIALERARLVSEVLWQTRVFFYLGNPKVVAEELPYPAHVQLVLDEEGLSEVECLNVVRLAPRAILLGDPAQRINSSPALADGTKRVVKSEQGENSSGGGGSLGQRIWRELGELEQNNSSKSDIESCTLTESAAEMFARRRGEGRRSVCHFLAETFPAVSETFDGNYGSGGDGMRGVPALLDWTNDVFYGGKIRRSETPNATSSRNDTPSLTELFNWLHKQEQKAEAEKNRRFSGGQTIIDFFDNTQKTEGTRAHEIANLVPPRFPEQALFIDADQCLENDCSDSEKSWTKTPKLFDVVNCPRLRSFYNGGQALVVAGYIHQLVAESGFHPHQFGVAVNGTAQMALVRQLLGRLLGDDAAEQIVIGEPLNFKANGWRVDVLLCSDVFTPTYSPRDMDLFLRKLNVLVGAARCQFVWVDFVSRLRSFKRPEVNKFVDVFEQRGRVLKPDEILETSFIESMLPLIQRFQGGFRSRSAPGRETPRKNRSHRRRSTFEDMESFSTESFEKDKCWSD